MTNYKKQWSKLLWEHLMWYLTQGNLPKEMSNKFSDWRLEYTLAKWKSKALSLKGEMFQLKGTAKEKRTCIAVGYPFEI